MDGSLIFANGMSSEGDIHVTTELPQATEPPPGFSDSIVVDVAESSARFGLAAGGIYTITAEAGGATGAAASSTSGGSVSSSSGLSTTAKVGIGAAAVAAAVAAGIGLAAGSSGSSDSGGSSGDQQTFVYNDPTIDGYPLDICLTIACEGPQLAADAFCQEQGHSQAIDFNIFHGQIVTKQIGDGILCEYWMMPTGECGRFTQITCVN